MDDSTRQLIDILAPLAETLRESDDTEADRRFSDLRNRSLAFVKEFRRDPEHAALADEGLRLVAEWERFEPGRSSIRANDRARVNVVTLSARMYRAYYAAYSAGRLAADPDFARPFKAWAHNAAANSALALFELSRQLVKDATESGFIRDTNRESYSSLKLLGQMAWQDAVKLLEIANDFDKGNVITTYNYAKAYVLQGTDAAIRYAMDMLLELPAPKADDPIYVLMWHDDNFTNLERRDKFMIDEFNRVAQGQGDRIKWQLAENAKQARAIKDRNGEVWTELAPRYRRVLVGAAIGAALTVLVATSRAATNAAPPSADQSDARPALVEAEVRIVHAVHQWALGETPSQPSANANTNRKGPGSDQTQAMARGDGGMLASVGRGDGSMAMGLSIGDGGMASTSNGLPWLSPFTVSQHSAAQIIESIRLS